MKGSEIAANLRESRLVWGKVRLVQKDTPSKRRYCVLGVKAREAGVSSMFLAYLDEGHGSIYSHPTLSTNESDLIKEVFRKNDSCFSKEECITSFDSPGYRDREYPIEKFVKLLKDLERKWRKERKVSASS